MKINKIAIIGAGNGGITAAADLTQRGFNVSLYELPQFSENLMTIKEKGGIELCEGNKATFIEVDEVTTDIRKAVMNAQIIMLVVPGFAIEEFASKLAPVVSPHQIIFLNGAASMGCVRFINKARDMGIDTEFMICESNSLTYGTRAFPKEAKVKLSLRVKKLFLAAYPSKNTQECLNACSQIYDCFIKAKNVLHTALENGNPEVHPGPCLLNAGRIDYSKGEFWLYKEGITEHTVNVLKAVEKERIEIGAKLGLEIENAIVSRARRGYFNSEKGDLQKLFNTSEVFTQIKGPISVTSRYFIEDISIGLVLWSDLGKELGVKTPNIDSIITLGGSLLGRDFYKEGLTLEKLRLTSNDLYEMAEVI